MSTPSGWPAHYSFETHEHLKGEGVLEEFWILDIKDPVDQETSRDGSNNVAASNNFYTVCVHSQSFLQTHLQRRQLVGMECVVERPKRVAFLRGHVPASLLHT